MDAYFAKKAPNPDISEWYSTQGIRTAISFSTEWTMTAKRLATRTISVGMRKSAKMLTAKYRLHFANGKDHIKEERLRPYDRAKHEIYKALKEELSQVQNWADLKDALADQDIDMKFKVSRTTREIQGVKFEHNGFSFSGSKVGREFSYLNIDNRLEENACTSLLESAKQEPIQQKEEVLQSVSHSGDGFDLSLGLLNGSSSYDATAAEEAELNRLMKRKKAKRKRGFHL